MFLSFPLVVLIPLPFLPVVPFVSFPIDEAIFFVLTAVSFLDLWSKRKRTNRIHMIQQDNVRKETVTSSPGDNAELEADEERPGDNAEMEVGEARRSRRGQRRRRQPARLEDYVV
ncbi:hypothetical protein NE237_009647 [Protea cynaroides]|uniref:Uncharacterized protein n=1 Tax=Protea cynaroides TaxID=273540 RepID=A0A9Q0R0U8_9MAGN|nr:hypothetical protein NE237_009647 [Protea cynaroides]